MAKLNNPTTGVDSRQPSAVGVEASGNDLLDCVFDAVSSVERFLTHSRPSDIAASFDEIYRELARGVPIDDPPMVEKIQAFVLDTQDLRVSLGRHHRAYSWPVATSPEQSNGDLIESARTCVTDMLSADKAGDLGKASYSADQAAINLQRALNKWF